MQNDASLADVAFVDRATGWAVGDRGVIWHTVDGGKTWQLQASGVTCRLDVGLLSSIARTAGSAGGAMRALFARLARRPAHDQRRRRDLDRNRAVDAAGDRAAEILRRQARHRGGRRESRSFPPACSRRTTAARTWQPLPSDAAASGSPPIFSMRKPARSPGRPGDSRTLMRRRVVHSPVGRVELAGVPRAAARAADRRLARRRRRPGDDRRTTWATVGRRRRANCRDFVAREFRFPRRRHRGSASLDRRLARHARVSFGRRRPHLAAARHRPERAAPRDRVRR